MTRAKWATVGVINSHDLVKLYAAETGEYGVYFGYSSNDGSRIMMGTLSGYYVYRPGFKTDPEAASWMDHGNKSFSIWATDYPGALADAVAWAHAKYGVSAEAVAIPGFGRDRFPTQIAEWAKAKLKGIKSD